MKVKIFGYKINNTELANSNDIAKYYDCEIRHFKCPNQLERALNNAVEQCVVLIDIDNSTINELDLTSTISKLSNVQVIFLANDTKPEDRVRWLSFGAASYIKKPFLIEEVFLRAKRIAEINSLSYVQDRNFTIDFRKRKTLFRGEEVKLTNKMLDVLVYFIENEGVILSRDKIMCDIFEADYYLSDRNVDTIIKQLRQEVHQDLIKTVRGRGYVYKSNSVLKNSRKKVGKVLE